MSYSVCFRCKTMVSSYEKYCPKCAKRHNQDLEFWKKPEAYPLFQNDEQRKSIIEADRKQGSFTSAYP